LGLDTGWELLGVGEPIKLAKADRDRHAVGAVLWPGAKEERARKGIQGEHCRLDAAGRAGIGCGVLALT